VDQIAVVVATGRLESEVKALRLALNRVPQDSTWNNERLRTEFSELVALSFDLELTGFEVVEIDSLLEVDVPQANVLEHPDIPARPENPVTTVGDVWICGDHRVTCADALDTSGLATFLDGQRADMAFCDPPYNLPVHGFVSGLGQTRHREFLQASGELNTEQFEGFLSNALQSLRQSLRAGAVAYVCIDWRHLYELLSAGRHCGLPVLNICVWAKTNAGMGSLYRSQHEMVVVFRSGEGQHENNVELGRHGRHRSNLWTYRGLNAFGTDRADLLASHPTVKPVAMIADAIRDVTRRNDTVLDLFLGSGSTLIATENTGRRCFGVELDPAYVDVAVRRWERATGRDAVNARTGAILADIKALRQQGSEDRHG
jgi:DNA modification methylase